MPKVSVIVPVYNVEKYLPRCLESILAQTLRDLEIICVDDGSTDDSGRILDHYASGDERIRVIHRANAGYGAAMNAGIDQASGEYIGIVESDDCIEAKMYQVLYDAARKDDLDLVKSDAYYWIEDIGYLQKIHIQSLDHYYDRVLYDMDRNIFFDFFMNIWTGIYKREFLMQNEIRFHESPGASYQDNGFWLQSLLYCRSAKWIGRAFYRYRQDNPAASVRSQDKMMLMAHEYEHLAQVLCKRKDYHLLPYCYYFKLYRHRGTFLRIADEQKRKFCEQIRNDFIAYKGFIRGSSFLEGWFREILTGPEEVCGRIIKKKKEIRNRLESSAGIMIYGAGKHGDIVFRGLYQEGYYDKICCFAVSEKSSRTQMAGRQILTIGEAHSLYPDMLIIIAVDRYSRSYDQMAAELTALGIRNFMDGSDLEENFYIV